MLDQYLYKGVVAAYAGLVLEGQKVDFDELLVFVSEIEYFHVFDGRNFMQVIDFRGLVGKFVPPDLKVLVHRQLDPILLAKKTDHVVFLQVK